MIILREKSLSKKVYYFTISFLGKQPIRFKIMDTHIHYINDKNISLKSCNTVQWTDKENYIIHWENPHVTSIIQLIKYIIWIQKVFSITIKFKQKTQLQDFCLLEKKASTQEYMFFHEYFLNFVNCLSNNYETAIYLQNDTWRNICSICNTQTACSG